MAESEKTTSMYLFFSGFGPFGEVKANPSPTIAKRVTEMYMHDENKSLIYREDINSAHKLTVPKAFYTELETSVAAVKLYFDELDRRLHELLNAEPNAQVLLCPIGVHSREENGLLRLEVRGYNELFASIPDVTGVVLNHQLINAEHGTREFYLESWIAQVNSTQLTHMQRYIDQSNDSEIKHQTEHENVYDVNKEGVKSEDNNTNNKAKPVRRLVTTHDSNNNTMLIPLLQPLKWTISIDAGRYLCNCALFYALMLQNKYKDNVVGVFIHVVDPSKGTASTARDDINKPDNKSSNRVAYNPTINAQVHAVGALVHEILLLISQR